MKYHVTHRTRYAYTGAAALSLNDVCLAPRQASRQRVLRHHFETDPVAEYYRDRVDYFGNSWRLFAFERPHLKLAITSQLSVEVTKTAGEGDGAAFGWEPFLQPSPFVHWNAAMADFARHSLPERPQPADLFALTEALFRTYHYDPKATEISTPPEEFFEKKRGVCQDFSHLLVALLRSRGVPARYVSGYLNTLPPPGKEKVVGADASHAWVAAYLPELGWFDLDPTNGIAVGSGHITVGWGRDYGDVSPLRGVVLGGGTQTLSVEVTVTSVAE